MIEPFEIILAEGGKRNSLGRGAEVVETVQNDPSRLDELFDCIYADDAWVRMRAIDSFEKLVRADPAVGIPYLDRIFSDLVHSDQPSIQWHIAQLFTEVLLDADQQKQAIAWLVARVSTTDVDWIVSVDVMKALLFFYEKDLVDSHTIDALFAVQQDHSSKSVRRKATEFRLKLEH